MIKRSSLFPALGALILIVALAPAPVAEAGGGLVMTEWPSAEDPGLPYYARIYNDGEWAAIYFYREPGCVPPEFNLLSFFDFTAFGCAHTVHGYSLWHGSIYNGAPKKIHSSGNGAVPVWFVPWTAVQDEAEALGGSLTVADLEQIEGLRIGSADLFLEELHPQGDPSFGGGGHPVAKINVVAHGSLEDGGSFKLKVNVVNGVPKPVSSIRIELKPD